MLTEKQELIRNEISVGTGAEIDLEVDRSNMQTGLRIWFADLRRTRSPIVELTPQGLHRYRAHLTFGNFAAETIAQIRNAESEEQQLARALVRSISDSAEVTISGVNRPGFAGGCLV